jgi:myo-inositol-1(or 4)-monophosphatase
MQGLLDFATEAAWQAGQLVLSRYQADLAVETKRDGSPVTAADREAETLLRRLIESRFPDHAVVGEELGTTDKDSAHRWYLDPIDGTRTYIRGVPLFGVLLGLEISGEMVLGVAHFPALGEMVAAAAGHGCRWNGRPARVSSVDRLERALAAYTDAGELMAHPSGVWDSLRRATALQRGWGDCYGHCLVATGRAEVMLDAFMNPWDCAALVPILREAGGTFTDWDGRTTIHGANAVSTNGALFEPVMRLLGGAYRAGR